MLRGKTRLSLAILGIAAGMLLLGLLLLGLFLLGLLTPPDPEVPARTPGDIDQVGGTVPAVLDAPRSTERTVVDQPGVAADATAPRPRAKTLQQTRVSVVDFTGKGIEHAHVTLSASGRIIVTGITNAQGIAVWSPPAGIDGGLGGGDATTIDNTVSGGASHPDYVDRPFVLQSSSTGWRASVFMMFTRGFNGRVTDSSGYPVRGASVYLVEHGNPRTLGNSRSLTDGSFSLPRPDGPHDRLRILATKKQMGSATREVDIGAIDGAGNPQDFRLQLDDAGSIHGWLTSKQGSGVPGMHLCAIAEGDYITTDRKKVQAALRAALLSDHGGGLCLTDAPTEESGRFTLTGLNPQKRYRLFLSNKMHEGTWGPFACGTNNVTIEIAAYPLKVIVVDSDNDPLAGALVVFEVNATGTRLASSITDASGIAAMVARTSEPVSITATTDTGSAELEVNQIDKLPRKPLRLVVRQ